MCTLAGQGSAGAVLDAIGWRVTELRPSIDHGPTLWSVTIERVPWLAARRSGR
jgi:hypothetical protein